MEKRTQNNMQIPDNIIEPTISLKDQFFDLRGLSAYSAISVGSLRDYVKTGMPHLKLKGKILVKRSEFDTWLEKYRVSRSQDLDNIIDEVMDSMT